MSYCAPDSPDVAQDVLLTLILNSETGDVLNETYYAYNADLGTYGELTADPSGIIVPNVLTIDAEGNQTWTPRSEEHTSELQSLMRISYAVFCLKKKNNK